MCKADECVRCHERYDAVADRAQSVHPIGQPISHSTHGGLRTMALGDRLPGVPVVGVGWPERKAVAWPGRSRPPWRCPGNGPFPSRACGVGHAFTATVRDVIPLRGPPGIRAFIARCASGDF